MEIAIFLFVLLIQLFHSVLS